MLSHLTRTRDNDRGPQYMESVFAALHGAETRRHHIRLIYTTRAGRVGLYMEYPKASRKTIERQILGQYPAAVLESVEDPPLAPAEDRLFWHRRMTLRPDLFPIKRYSQYEDPAQRELADPLTAIFEALNTDPPNDLRPMIEISIRPASRRRAKQARRAIQQAVMTRSDLPESERRDFYLYADEFQRFDTPAIQTLLSESRKMRLALMLSHQYLDQLEDPTRQAIFGNAGTYIAFGLGSDAEAIRTLFGEQFPTSDLVQIPKYHAYTAAMVDGKTSTRFLIQTLKPRRSLLSETKTQTLINLSRHTHATPAAKVQQQIEGLLARV